MNFVSTFLSHSSEICETLNHEAIDKAIICLQVQHDRGGRLFILGSGGGAGHASHAVNDFRKIAGFEAYSPSDNVSELTARINDEGWDGCYAAWLATSRLCDKDALLVFSVGGGDEEHRISMNLVEAMRLAKQRGAKIVAVVGPKGGYAAIHADACVQVGVPEPQLTTPLTEAFQAVVWHLFVSDERLKVNQTKWESVKK